MLPHTQEDSFSFASPVAVKKKIEHSSFRSTSSPLLSPSPSIADDESVPWWTTAGMASISQDKFSGSIQLGSTTVDVPPPATALSSDGSESVISAMVDSISLLDEDQSVTTLSCISGTSTDSPRKRASRHEKVEDFETTDSYGRKVTYTGYISKSQRRPHGKGKMRWLESGNIYTGSFRHGCLDGYGRIKYANGDQFEGLFAKDLRNGRGVFRVKRDGRIVDCIYKNDLPDDPNGTMTWNNGTIYIGSFIEGKRTGKAIQRFPNGVRYQGDFVAGKYHGFGLCEFEDGSVYKGEWVKGKAHGEGKLVKASGAIVHDGNWEHDAPVYED